MALQSIQGAPGMEYNQHLAQWKEAFASLYRHQQPQREVGVAQAGSGAGNPYAAVLTGLQSLLEGPLFKGQAGQAASPAAGAEDQAAELDEEGEQGEEEDEAPAEAGVVSPAARSPAGRRPRKRQAGSPQADAAADEQESPAAAAAAPPAPPAAAARQPATKKRRNTQSSTPAPRPPPSSNSLQDLAALAEVLAHEDIDDPVLCGDEQMQQDQGGLATYASGSLAGGQGDGAAASGRGARGGGRGRQRTPAPSSSGADEGDSLGLSFPLVNEDGKPLTKQQIKRLRRQQSNRESARRSRQRKAEEANMLARRVGELEVTCAALNAKNSNLLAEVQQLRSIFEMMAGDGAALAAQVAELGGDVAPEIMANINWLAGARANFSTTQAGAGAQLPAAGQAQAPEQGA